MLRYQTKGRNATRDDLIAIYRDQGYKVGESPDGAALAIYTLDGWEAFASRLLDGTYGPALPIAQRRTIWEEVK